MKFVTFPSNHTLYKSYATGTIKLNYYSRIGKGKSNIHRDGDILRQKTVGKGNSYHFGSIVKVSDS